MCVSLSLSSVKIKHDLIQSCPSKVKRVGTIGQIQRTLFFWHFSKLQLVDAIHDSTTAQGPRGSAKKKKKVFNVKSFICLWVLCTSSSVLKLLTCEVCGCQMTSKSLWEILSDELIILTHNVSIGKAVNPDILSGEAPPASWVIEFKSPPSITPQLMSNLGNNYEINH